MLKLEHSWIEFIENLNLQISWAGKLTVRRDVFLRFNVSSCGPITQYQGKPKIENNRNP